MTVIVWCKNSELPVQIFHKIFQVVDLGHECIVLKYQDGKPGQPLSNVIQVQCQPEKNFSPPQ